MDGLELRLLEHTAIRYETKMDYKVWRELESLGLIFKKDYPVISDLERIYKNRKTAMISDRSVTLIHDALVHDDVVRRTVDKYVSLTQKNSIKMICSSDNCYPQSWNNYSGMPPVVFAKGDLEVLSHAGSRGSASIVGSRQPGRYSLYATSEFAASLSKKGIVIVSGMALGIDRQAHERCLDEDGETIAVVPGGCDVIYPFQNRDIYDRICEHGLVISELPPGQEVIKQYFPSRNRLISALGDVCLIMEAGIHSGTLHTASYAANQGKDVFVLPNSIYSENSLGGLLLLRDGAEVLIDADTVLERISIENKNRYLNDEEFMQRCESHSGISPGDLKDIAKENPDELDEHDWKRIVCDEISERPKNIDELAISLGIPFSFLSALVIGLETEGVIANEKGKYVLTIHGR